MVANVTLRVCDNRTQARTVCASGPRGPRLLNYDTIELHRKNLTEGALELRLDAGYDLNRFILKMYCQLLVHIQI